MRSPRILALAVIIVPLVAIAVVKTHAARAAETRLERGRYLVSMMGCSDCHTPMKIGAHGPEPDTARMLSGHPEGIKMTPPPPPNGSWLWHGAATNTAFAGPWGVSYAANLTADQNTGLGIWTEDMFVTALRSGRHMGKSRPIAPPMPWQAFATATDEDLKSIYAYLKTVKPIVNHVPDFEPPKDVPTQTR